MSVAEIIGAEDLGDPGESIAAALTNHLNETSLSLSYTAQKPDNLVAAYKLERQSLTLLLGPFEEEAIHIDRGSAARETFSTTVVIIRKLSNEFNRERLSKFAREVKVHLRGVHVNVDGKIFRWAGDTTETKYDPEQINELQQFASVVRVQHIGIT